jgi:hypothetical protein
MSARAWFLLCSVISLLAAAAATKIIASAKIWPTIDIFILTGCVLSLAGGYLFSGFCVRVAVQQTPPHVSE